MVVLSRSNEKPRKDSVQNISASLKGATWSIIPENVSHCSPSCFTSIYCFLIAIQVCFINRLRDLVDLHIEKKKNNVYPKLTLEVLALHNQVYQC